MQHEKINYLELPAKDLRAIKAFYQGVFNWSFTDYGDGYTAFNDGTIDGGFYLTDARVSQDKGGVLIVFYSKDLEATQSKVVANGGKIVKATFDFPGGRRFHFTDPNGNELAVWSDS